jgi:hypothetical protein
LASVDTTADGLGKMHDWPAKHGENSVDASWGIANMSADRDEHGRFVPGNQAAVGNCGQHHRAAIRHALVNAQTPEDVAWVGQLLLELAHSPKVSAGTRVAAIRTWLEAVIGKPRVAPDDSEDDELGIDANDILNVVCEVLSTVPNGAEIRRKLAEAIRQLEEDRGLRDRDHWG